MEIYFSRVIWCSKKLWYMTGIFYYFYRYIPRLLRVSIHCGFITNENMKLPPQIRSSMHRCLSRLGIARYPLQSIFYWAIIYDRYIPALLPGICMSCFSGGRFRVRFSCTPLSGLQGIPGAPGHFRPGLSADPLGFGDRIRGWVPAKVPQPVVDLIGMAAPAWFLACAEFEGLLLSRSVLVWNGRGGVAIKKARKEWHQVGHRQR